jgi:hypothetical protein
VAANIAHESSRRRQSADLHPNGDAHHAERDGAPGDGVPEWSDGRRWQWLVPGDRHRWLGDARRRYVLRSAPGVSALMQCYTGCSYPNAWDAVTAAVPAAPCTGGGARQRRAALPTPTPVLRR